MRKMKLDLDQLDVVSFATDEAAGERGTVHGNLGTFACDTVNATCDGAATCGEFTCRAIQYSCALSCTGCDTYECTGEGSNLGTWPTAQSGIGCNLA